MESSHYSISSDSGITTKHGSEIETIDENAISMSVQSRKAEYRAYLLENTKVYFVGSYNHDESVVTNALRKVYYDRTGHSIRSEHELKENQEKTTDVVEYNTERKTISVFQDPDHSQDLETLFAFMNIKDRKELKMTKNEKETEAMKNFIQKRTAMGFINGKILKRESYRFRRLEKRDEQNDLNTERNKRMHEQEWRNTRIDDRKRRIETLTDSSDAEDDSSGFVDKRPRNDYLEVVKKHSKPLGTSYQLSTLARAVKQAAILVHDKPDKEYTVYSLADDILHERGNTKEALEKIVEFMKTEDCHKQARFAGKDFLKNMSHIMDEPNTSLLNKLKKSLGRCFMLRVLMLTAKVEAYGGMSTQFTGIPNKSKLQESYHAKGVDQRRRTTGGVFFYLARTMGLNLTAEEKKIRDDIFEEEQKMFHEKLASERGRGGDIRAKLLGVRKDVLYD